jgi:hypothetical protein
MLVNDDASDGLHRGFVSSILDPRARSLPAIAIGCKHYRISQMASFHQFLGRPVGSSRSMEIGCKQGKGRKMASFRQNWIRDHDRPRLSCDLDACTAAFTKWLRFIDFVLASVIILAHGDWMQARQELRNGFVPRILRTGFSAHPALSRILGQFSPRCSYDGTPSQLLRMILRISAPVA